MRAVIIALALFSGLAGISTAAAELAPGLSFIEITPADFANSTVLSLAFDPNGNLWASDGQFLSTVPVDGTPSTSEPLVPPIPANEAATDIIFDSAGRLYLADFGNARILVREPGGVNFQVFATGLARPRRMAFDGSGNLLVIGGNGTINDVGYVKRVDQFGNVNIITSVIVGPVAIALNSGDEIFVLTWQGEVLRLSADGVAHLFATLPPPPEPNLVTRGESLAINADDVLFVGVSYPSNDPPPGINQSGLLRITPAGILTQLGRNVGDGIQLDLVFAPTGELFAANFKAQVLEETVLWIPGTPVQKADCKNPWWSNFFNPSFKNQGNCVRYVDQQTK